MFTVKHRESACLGGNEYLYSANEIMIVHKGNHFEDGIYLDPEPPAEPVPVEGDAPAEPQPAPQFSRRIILFGGNQTTDAPARMGGHVWIMNETGATVASYEL